MQRRYEQFSCGKCDETVVPLPTGTRNHCNHCLHSAHMDADEPGDRLSECKGLMEPIGVETRHGVYIILHRCTECGHERTNKSVADDNIAALMQVAQSAANTAMSKHSSDRFGKGNHGGRGYGVRSSARRRRT